MPFLIDDAILLGLAAASAAGAIKGGAKKQIDPEWLRANYGPGAVTQEALDMFNRIINSPKGQQMINEAASTGQSFGNAMNVKAAQAGLTPMGGAGSGVGAFATSAGEQASNKLVTDVKGNLMTTVLPLAQQAVQDRMNAYLGIAQQGGLPTNEGRIWSNIGNAAGVGLSMMPTSTPKVDTTSSPAARGSTTPAASTLQRSSFQQEFGQPAPATLLRPTPNLYNSIFNTRLSRYPGSFNKVKRI